MPPRRRKRDGPKKPDAAAQAKDFARLYVNLVEALRQQGVPEEVARVEARLAALTRLRQDELEFQMPVYDPALGACPTCGQG